jgi:hypothetical protein
LSNDKPQPKAKEPPTVRGLCFHVYKQAGEWHVAEYTIGDDVLGKLEPSQKHASTFQAMAGTLNRWLRMMVQRQ